MCHGAWSSFIGWVTRLFAVVLQRVANIQFIFFNIECSELLKQFFSIQFNFYISTPLLHLINICCNPPVAAIKAAPPTAHSTLDNFPSQPQANLTRVKMDVQLDVTLHLNITSVMQHHWMFLWGVSRLLNYLKEMPQYEGLVFLFLRIAFSCSAVGLFGLNQKCRPTKIVACPRFLTPKNVFVF